MADKIGSSVVGDSTVELLPIVTSTSGSHEKSAIVAPPSPPVIAEKDKKRQRVFKAKMTLELQRHKPAQMSFQ